VKTKTHSIGPKIVGAKIQNQLDLKQWEHKHIINWTLKQWEQKHRFTIDIKSNGTLLKQWEHNHNHFGTNNQHKINSTLLK
jgi:hypothetical protein